MIEPLDPHSDEMTERLLHLFRYGQVGRCVSSVTHDVNNFLGSIVAYTDLLEMSGAIKEDASHILNEISNGAKRCSALLGLLTNVARGDRNEESIIDVTTLVEHVLELRRHDVRINRITVETIIEPGIPTLFVNQSKIEIALLCLILNAMEQVTGKEERRIRIQANRVESQVVIDIWNSSLPIDAEEQGALFTPFMTSKKDEHLGLGLSFARQMLRDHGGDIVYDPQRGFVVTLPVKNQLFT